MVDHFLQILCRLAGHNIVPSNSKNVTDEKLKQKIKMQRPSSTIDLSSRLNPAKSTVRLGQTNASVGLGTSSGQRTLLNSQSQPALTVNPTKTQMVTSSQNKLERLIAESLPSHGGFGVKNSTISTSASAALLLNVNGGESKEAARAEAEALAADKKGITGLNSTAKDNRRDAINFSFVESLTLSAKQHQDLIHVPQTFFYLRIREEYSSSGATRGKSETGLRKPFSITSGSVYDLEIVEQKDINKNCYFTLSKQGVTFFRNKTSQFTSLPQWEREYDLFHKISSIKFFRLYKRWKVSNCRYLLFINIHWS